MTDGLVLLVTFMLRPGQGAAFLEKVRVNAALSVRDEPGCRRFDVLVPNDAQDEIVLYEIYDDAAAFDAHLATPHYAAFQAGTAGIVEKMVARRLSLGEYAKPAA